ncbi:Alginate lyase [Gluconobacter japonicus]|nr:Alginate lyase [Gluconobacter japonicus]
MLSRFAVPLFCLAAFATAPAQAMDTGLSTDISSFTLQEPAGRLSLHLVPSTTLASGYGSSFFARNPQTGSVTIQTDGLQPPVRGKIAPETLLRENSAWYFQQTSSDMQASLHIDRFPENGHITIGRLTSQNGAVAELRVEGDRVLAIVNNGTSTQNVVVGTVYPQQTVRYAIHTTPNGLLVISVNGTVNHFSLPSAATTHALWFEAVAGEQGFHRPSHSDAARVTFTGLQVHHQAA